MIDNFIHLISSLGFNSTLRRGCITYHEYMQVGKGRDVGLNQISKFEAKVANGNSEQTLSRDIYRLAHQFDFFRMLSCYFTTIGFYFSSLVTCYNLKSRALNFSVNIYFVFSNMHFHELYIQYLVKPSKPGLSYYYLYFLVCYLKYIVC